MHCDLRVRWKVASDLRFWAVISEPKTPSFCGISGDLAPSTRKSLAIAIVQFGALSTRISLEFHSNFTRTLLFHRCPLEGCPSGASKFRNRSLVARVAQNAQWALRDILVSRGKNCRKTIFVGGSFFRVAADVWEKDVGEFQAKSGSSGSCRLFLHFFGKITVQETSGRMPGSPRHHSSRHPWSSDNFYLPLELFCLQ